MRYMLTVLIALALASTAGAGTINLPPITVDDTTQVPFLKSSVKTLNTNTCQRLGLAIGCSDAEAKVVDADATIYPSTLAGYESFSTWRLTAQISQDVSKEQERKAADDIAKAYRRASAAIQAQVDTLLGVTP